MNKKEHKQIRILVGIDYDNYKNLEAYRGEIARNRVINHIIRNFLTLKAPSIKFE